LPPATPRLAHGTTVFVDGASHVVRGFDGPAVLLARGGESPWRIDQSALFSFEDFRVLDGSIPRRTPRQISDAALLACFEQADLDRAAQLVEHLHEYRTGYRSGTQALRRAGEPRAAYKPDETTEAQRARAKAAELRELFGIKCSPTTLRRWWQDYTASDVIGLLDIRKVKAHKPLQELDSRVLETCEELFEQYRGRSDIGIVAFIDILRAELVVAYPGQEIPLPSSETTLRRRVKELAAVYGFRFKGARRRQTDALRPDTPYYRKRPERPGEFVLIDATRLDVFAVDPATNRPTRLDLLVAMDLYTRAIVGWRLCPHNTNRVDAALLLRDVIMPKPMRPGWPEAMRWRYHGIPEHVVIDLCSDYKRDDAPYVFDDDEGLAGIPMLWPETVVVDNAWAYGSWAFRRACRKLGITIQPARPKRPTDKAHVERLFRTINEFFKRLPGYTGNNIEARGEHPDRDAFYFISELEDKLAQWISGVYHNTFHRGCRTCAACKLELSPNDMYDAGLARAGFLYAPPDPDLYMELLPVEARPIHHYGVELFGGGMRFDGEGLNGYRGQLSGIGGQLGDLWPIAYDPRDLRCVWFRDPHGSWHRLDWEYLPEDGGEGPMSAGIWEAAKRELARRYNGRTAQARRDEVAAIAQEMMVRVRSDSRALLGEKRALRRAMAEVFGLERDVRSTRLMHLAAMDPDGGVQADLTAGQTIRAEATAAAVADPEEVDAGEFDLGDDWDVDDYDPLPD
jgi:transposase InsO family protein